MPLVWQILYFKAVKAIRGQPLTFDKFLGLAAYKLF